MYKWITALLLTGCIAFACKKEKSFEQDGNNPIIDSANYFPTTAQSTWKYEVHESFDFDTTVLQGIDLSQFGITQEELAAMLEGSAVQDTTYTYTVVSSGDDTLMNGIHYTAMSSQEDGSEFYIGHDNGDYYLKGNLLGSAEAGLSDTLQTLFLKSDQAVGSSWQEQHVIDGDTINYQYSIKARGIDKTVNGTTYKNVIQVEMLANLPEIEDPGIPGFQYILSAFSQIRAEYFYAPDIGFIFYEMAPVIGNSVSVALIEADIK
jgi:hypothetical protein